MHASIYAVCAGPTLRRFSGALEKNKRERNRHHDQLNVQMANLTVSNSNSSPLAEASL